MNVGRVVEWRPVKDSDLVAEGYLDDQEARVDDLGLGVYCRPDGSWGWYVERTVAPVWDVAGNADTEANAKVAAEKAAFDRIAQQTCTTACQH